MIEAGRLSPPDSTHVGRLLEQGDEAWVRAAAHVEEVYAGGLRIYAEASSFRKLAASDELVGVFLAERVHARKHLRDWWMSGRRLRRWLLTGFRHYLLERARGQSRFRRIFRFRAHEEADAEVAYDRAIAAALVRAAVRAAEVDCRTRGLAAQWNACRARFLDGAANVARGDDRHAPARVAATRIRRALRAMVAWPTAGAEAIDAELRDLVRLVEATPEPGADPIDARAIAVLQLGLAHGGGRLADMLVRCLESDDGHAWLLGMLDRQLNGEEHAMLLRGGTLEDCLRIKERGRRMIDETRGSGDAEAHQVAGLAVHAFAAASCLVHHGRQPTALPESEWHDLLAELAALAPEPWRALAERACSLQA